MAGVVTAGIRFVTEMGSTLGFRQFQENIRELRINLLGFEQIAGSIERFGDAFLSIAEKTGDAIVSLIQSSIELDDVMTQILTVGGDKLGATIDELRESFLRLSSTVPLSARALGEVGVEVARAGIEGRAAIESFALVSGQLAAIADDLAADEAARALIRISNNFGIATEDMAGNARVLGDTLSKLAGAGVTTEGAIVDVVIRMAQSAHGMRITQHEAAALAATVLNMGVSAEVAGTAFAQTFAGMMANTTKFARESGVAVETIQGLIRERKGLAAFQLILEGIAQQATIGSEVDPILLQEAFTRMGITGKRQREMLVGLVQQYGKLEDQLRFAGESQGDLQRRFDIASTSLKKVLETLEGAFENLKASFGDVLKPILVPVLEFLTRVINFMVELPAPIKFGIIAVLGLVAAFAGIVGASLVAIAGFTAMVVSLGFLAQAFSRVHAEYNDFVEALRAQQALSVAHIAAEWVGEAAATTGPRAVLAKFRGAKGIGVEQITRKAGAIPGLGGLGTAQGMLQAIPGAVTSLGALGPALLIAGKAALVIGGAVAMAAVVAVAFRREINGLVDAFKSLGDPIVAALGLLREVTGQTDLIGAGIAFTLGVVRLVFAPIGSILNLVSAVLRVVSTIGVMFVDIVRPAVMTIVEPIRRFAGGISVIAARIRALAGGFSIFGALLASLRFTVSLFLIPLTLGLRAIGFYLNILLSVIGGVIEGFARAFGPVIDDVRLIFSEISMGFAEIRAAFQPLIDTFAELFGGLGSEFDLFGVLVQAVAAVVRIAVTLTLIPLRAVLFVVQMLIRGWRVFGRTVAAVLGPAVQWINKALSPLLTLVRTMRSIGSLGTQLSNSLKHAFEDFGASISGVFEEIIDWPRRFFDELWTEFSTWATRIEGTLRALMGLGSFLSLVPLHSGGITSGPTPALLHGGEAVAPISDLPSLLGMGPPPVATPTAALSGGVAQSGARHATAPGGPPTSGGAAPVSLSLSIPVQVMLEGVELGRALVNVTEDQIRQHFGSRGIRLAGIG